MYCEYTDLEINRKDLCIILVREIRKTTDLAVQLMLKYFKNNLDQRRRLHQMTDKAALLEKKVDEFQMTRSEFLLNEICALIVQLEKEDCACLIKNRLTTS